MRALHQRSLVAAAAGGLLSRLMGHPIAAGGASCSAQAAATALGAEAWPLTQLDVGQRDIYQRAIAALRHDPQYAGLGHPDADWTNLAARNNCLVLAMQIRNPDPASGEIGRPQLEMIAQIDDLSGRSKGTLIRDLSEQKELNGQLKSLA